MFRVALLQMLSGRDQKESLEKGLTFCRQAKAMGADLALFPEMWNIGYTFPDDPEQLKEMAINTDSHFLKVHGELAKELNMAIGVTYLEQHEPQPRNTLTIFDRFGRSVLTYAKVHL